MSLSRLILSLALSFLGVPYVAGTLEVNAPDERLVVNSEGVDCTTFVDQVLALTLDSLDGAGMETHLQRLRYRDGIVDGYASRLHYFTDFVADGIRKGLLTDVLAAWPDSTVTRVGEVTLSFMTTHPQSYTQLKDNPAEVAALRTIEGRYRRYPYRYLPTAALARLDRAHSPIRDGDVVALVTTVDGLDVTHLGFAVWQGDAPRDLHLLHASSAKGKVILDPQPLCDYLAPRKSCPGIRVVRLNSDY